VVPSAPGDVGYLQSSPCIIGDTAFLVTGNGVGHGSDRLIAPEAPSFIAAGRHTGEIRWKHQPADTGIRGATLIAGALTFITANDVTITALDSQTGTVQWQRNLGAHHNDLLAYHAPTVVGPHLYLPTEEGILYQLAIHDARKTTRTWEFPGTHSEHATPIPVPGGLVVATRSAVFRLKIPPPQSAPRSPNK